MSAYDLRFEQDIQKSIMDSGMPLREIALALGKPYSTLMREINPFDEHAKLGLLTALSIMQITGNQNILKLMQDYLDNSAQEAR